MVIQPQFIGYVISSSTTSRCSPAPIDVGSVSPRCLRHSLVLGEVGGVPGEPLADRPPVDAEALRRLLLADVPLPDFRNCTTATRHPRATRAHDDAERGGRLALAVAGVDEHERSRPAQLLGSGVLERWLVRRSRRRSSSRFLARRWGTTTGPSLPSSTVTSAPKWRRRCSSVSTSRGGPTLHDAAAVEQHELVGVEPGERQVVHRRHDGEAALAAQASTSSSTSCWWPMSSAVVGSSSRSTRRLLEQGAGEQHPLALAARQRLDGRAAQSAHVEQRRASRRRASTSWPALACRRTGGAACGRAARSRATRDARRDHRGLRHERNEPGACAVPQIAARRAPKSSTRPAHGTMPGDRAQQRRLAGAVRARRPRPTAPARRTTSTPSRMRRADRSSTRQIAHDRAAVTPRASCDAR